MYGTFDGTVLGISPLIFNNEILLSMEESVLFGEVPLSEGSDKPEDKIGLAPQCLLAGFEPEVFGVSSRRTPSAPSSALQGLLKNPPDLFFLY